MAGKACGFVCGLGYEGKDSSFLFHTLRKQLTGHQMVKLLSTFCLALCICSQSFATQMYGNFIGDDVTYENVNETTLSPGDVEPLFGAPTINAASNSLDFDPVNFNASATGAGGNDTTSALVEFDVVANAGKSINTLKLTEAGTTTLSGFGTDATYSAVTADVVIDIEEVDGGTFAGGPINFTAPMSFTPSNGDFGLATDGSGGPLLNRTWSGIASIDLDAVLTANSIPFTGGASRISVTLTNTLLALSEDGTTAIISKQDADSALTITANIPEPASLAMVLVGGLAVASRRRR